jgi:hypothetical protein
MGLTTKDNVLCIAPKLITASDCLWNLILAEVDTSISASVFGNKTQWAATNWVAHHMTLLTDESLANVSGPLTKDRVGDVMKEYTRINKVNRGEEDYGRTGFGRTFLAIRNSRVASFRVVPPGV